MKEILFKSILYRLPNRVETFLDFGGIPNLSSLSKFLNYLNERKENNETMFTAAHQNMGLHKTLEFVKKNISSVTTKVVAGARQTSNRACFCLVTRAPNISYLVNNIYIPDNIVNIHVKMLWSFSMHLEK